MICQSARDSPTGGRAWRTRWTRRSLLVNVPSFSAKLAEGRITSASSPVSFMKISMQTTKSRASMACCAWLRLGSLISGFSPMTTMARICPVRAPSTISVTVRPGLGGRATSQARSKLPRISGSSTRW